MPRGRSRTPRGPGVLRGAGPGCLRGRSCAPRGRFCGGELVLGASGDRVALWGGNPASPGPVLLGGGGGGPGCLRRSGCTVGGRSCTPRGQSQCRAWAGRMQDALGILVELPRGCLGWQSWQLQDPRVWLQKVGAGTAWLSPGVPSCLPGRGQGTALSPLPVLSVHHGSLCRASLQAKLLHSARARCWPGPSARLAPAEGGEHPQLLPPS